MHDGVRLFFSVESGGFYKIEVRIFLEKFGNLAYYSVFIFLFHFLSYFKRLGINCLGIYLDTGTHGA